jgi:flagellar biosynthetic protein FliQ
VTDSQVLEIAFQAMVIAAKLAAPILLVVLCIGVGVGLLQSVTSIQEATLTFVPKFVAVAVVLLISGSWMLQELVAFTRNLYDMIPSLIGSG